MDVMNNETAHQEEHNPDATQGIRVSAWKAFGVVASTILVTFVGTAFTIGGILNADHFTVLSHGVRISALEDKQLTKELYEADQRATQIQLKGVVEGLQELKDSNEKIVEELQELNDSRVSYIRSRYIIPSPTPTASRAGVETQPNYTVIYADQPQDKKQTQPNKQDNDDNEVDQEPQPSPVTEILSIVQSILPIDL